MLAALSVPNQVSQAAPKRKLSSASPPPHPLRKMVEHSFPFARRRRHLAANGSRRRLEKISQRVLTSSCSIRVGNFGENARHGGGTISHQNKPDLTLYYQNSICAGQVSRVLCGLLWFFK